MEFEYEDNLERLVALRMLVYTLEELDGKVKDDVSNKTLKEAFINELERQSTKVEILKEEQESEYSIQESIAQNNEYSKNTLRDNEKSKAIADDGFPYLMAQKIYMAQQNMDIEIAKIRNEDIKKQMAESLNAPNVMDEYMKVYNESSISDKVLCSSMLDLNNISIEDFIKKEGFTREDLKGSNEECIKEICEIQNQLMVDLENLENPDAFNEETIRFILIPEEYSDGSTNMILLHWDTNNPNAIAATNVETGDTLVKEGEGITKKLFESVKEDEGFILSKFYMEKEYENRQELQSDFTALWDAATKFSEIQENVEEGMRNIIDRIMENPTKTNENNVSSGVARENDNIDEIELGD